MATKKELAQLSLYVYNVPADAEQKNRPNLPSSDWVVLEYSPDNTLGFSYGIFKNNSTGEVVVAYTGSNEKLVVDFLLTNIPAGVGVGSTQISGAAVVAARTIQTYGAQNVSFTGHSLGGGLASIMSVWFNRPAVVFDHAPFELAARNPLFVQASKLALALQGYPLGDFLGYNEFLNFATRELNVQGHHIQGEALQYLRSAVPTIGGSQSLTVGQGLGTVEMHSMALYVAAELSPSFVQATLLSDRFLPRIFDDKLYAYDAAGSADRNFLIDLIRSEQQTPGSGKLTHFAADLNKLGTNLTGLNQQAQDAIIAQGIEWYYFQSSSYSGAEFMTVTNSVLQYTTATGAALPAALNKAGKYTDKWLTSLVAPNTQYGLSINFDQWNVVTANTAATVTAKDNTKSQIFIGGAGADNFTGGDKADTFIAGDGADSLTGGAGGDFLYGGAGNDSYTFSGTFGDDTIVDSDGAGIISVDSTTLNGGKKIGENVWESTDGVYRYQLFSRGGGNDLVIGRGSKATTGQMQGSGQALQKLLLNQKQTIELMHELGADLIQNLLKTPQNGFNIPEMGILRLPKASCARAKRWRGDLMQVRPRSRVGRCA